MSRSLRDEERLEFIRADGRVVVTPDTGFLRIASQAGDQHGTAFSHKDAILTGQIIRSPTLGLQSPWFRGDSYAE